MQGLLQEDHILVQEVSQRAFGFWSISSLFMAIQYLRFFFFKNQFAKWHIELKETLYSSSQ